MKGKIPLLKLNNMVKVKVVNRPSKIIRSPFMADVVFEDKQYMAHSPSLSCCNFIATGRQVWAEKRDPKEKTAAKSQFTIQLGIALDSNIQVGTHPSLGNRLAKIILQKKILDLPFNYSKQDIFQEVTYMNSRFDFEIRNQQKHVIQVKYVPIALHEDIDITQYNEDKYKNQDHFKKIALFPVGQKGTKCLKDAVSPRAVKHLEELSSLVKKKIIKSATLLFVILRHDIEHFKISQNDVYYLKAIKQATEKGVKLRAVCIEWKDCQAYFKKEVPVRIK